MDLRKGAWSPEEDTLLRRCIEIYGEGNWHLVPTRAGLSRCRKSCRLRWLNYLKPDIKRGEFQEDEIDLIFRMHRLLGNRWALIAGRIPGRTANDIKNYWNSHLSKKLGQNASNANICKDAGANKPVINEKSTKKSIKENKKTSSNERINPPVTSPEEDSSNIILKKRPLNLSANFVYQDRSDFAGVVSKPGSSLETGTDEGVAHPIPSNEELGCKVLLSDGDKGQGSRGEVPGSPLRTHDDGEAIGGIVEIEYGDSCLDADALWRLILD